MKLVSFVMILSGAMLTYGQQAGIPSSNSPPGAYTPHPNPAGMDAPPPADRPPQDVLAEDSKLVAKLQRLLPSDLTPQQACEGFKTLGGCVAAMHAAQNLGVSLSDLKSKIAAAKTGKEAEKLENAIRELKPDVDAKAQKKKAQKQAERDIPVSN